MMNALSYFCLWLGAVFWLWGTWPLLNIETDHIGVHTDTGHRTVLFKLHSLSVADTLGSMAILFGLLLQISQEWPLLILALIALAIWNTVLGYVLAYCSAYSSDYYSHSKKLLSHERRLP